MSNYVRHPYHLVDESPWPLLVALGAFNMASGLLKWFHWQNGDLVVYSGLVLLLLVSLWWRDVSRESTYVGLHSDMVELGLRWGMILFIVSEVFFFLSFFWAFFHSSLAVAFELGGCWPPQGVKPFDPFSVPLFNTVILLSSGVSVTWAHHSLMTSLYSSSSQGVKLTVMLGVVFLAVQAMEYQESSFAFSDGAYGSTFFMATGFHGLHVLVGTMFLIVSVQRLESASFVNNHHFGFEAAAWYWHFVDVVWLFLFVSIYWWGSA